jgi:hypothetical protein
MDYWFSDTLIQINQGVVMKLKINMLLAISTLGANVFLASHSNAESQFYIETDPATFLMKGDSFHIKYSSTSLPNWRFGLGTYSLEFPSALVDVNSENKNKGWDVEVTRGVGFFSEYYFNESLDGLMVGLQVSEQKMNVSSSKLNESAEFTNGMAMGSIGYRYNFEGTNFYVLPWAGFGYTTTTDGKDERVASTYDQDPWIGFMTFHLGYSF